MAGCFNAAFLPNVKALDFMGPDDTATSALTVYSGPPDPYYSGQSLTIMATDGSENNIGFIPRSFIITGTDSWAFYSGNFSGTTVIISVPELPFNFGDLIHLGYDVMSVRKLG